MKPALAAVGLVVLVVAARIALLFRRCPAEVPDVCR
jgi:hypothetical protein